MRALEFLTEAVKHYYHGSRNDLPVGTKLTPQSEGYVVGTGMDEIEKEAHLRLEGILERYRPAKQVKDRMIAIWRERKAERERRAKEDSTAFTVISNPQGGGLVISAPNLWAATNRALEEFPHKFPNGILGVKDYSTNETLWFTVPKTQVGQMPAWDDQPPVVTT